jgi:hypothetical protein
MQRFTEPNRISAQDSDRTSVQSALAIAKRAPSRRSWTCPGTSTRHRSQAPTRPRPLSLRSMRLRRFHRELCSGDPRDSQSITIPREDSKGPAPTELGSVPHELPRNGSRWMYSGSAVARGGNVAKVGFWGVSRLLLLAASSKAPQPSPQGRPWVLAPAKQVDPGSDFT